MQGLGKDYKNYVYAYHLLDGSERWIVRDVDGIEEIFPDEETAEQRFRELVRDWLTGLSFAC